MKMTAAEAMVEILMKEGIKDAFGIPGAGINPVYKYLDQATINHYCMRHEEACMHAADAYYRASHEIALAICTSGPAATNFVTGLYTAHIDSIPVLAIVGQVNTWQLDKDPFQCVDMVNVASTVCKKVFRPMHSTEIPSIMQEAFFLMRSGKPGPVLVDFPIDVQMGVLDFDIESYQSLPISTKEPLENDIKMAVDLIEQSKKPVIIMGGGVILSRAEQEVTAFAERLQVPIITTYMAKGGIPIDHPLNAGHMGIQVGQPIGNDIFLAADLVIGIGCRFSDRHTGALDVYVGSRKFIHIDIEEKQIGKVFRPDLGIVSDARLAVVALLKEVNLRQLSSFGWMSKTEFENRRKNLERKTGYDEIPMMPHRVYAEINKAFDAETMFTTGCGNCQIWSGQLQKIDKPMKYFPSGGAGTLGFDIPAAFGAKVAHPDNLSVTVLGDFGFTFMVEELAVAAVYSKPIIVIIVNNGNLGLIRQNQKGAYGYEYGVDMPFNQNGTIDYVKVSEGLGCQGERVYTPSDLALALDRAKKSSKTYVIDVICNTEQMCDMGPSIAAIKSFA